MQGPAKNFKFWVFEFNFSKNHLNVKAEIKILNDFYLAGLDSIFCHDWLTPRGVFCHAGVQVSYFKKVFFLTDMLKNFENEILLAGRLKSKIDCQKSNIALSVNTVDFWCKQDLIFQTHLNKRVANFFSVFSFNT